MSSSQIYTFQPPPVQSWGKYFFTTESGVQYEVAFGKNLEKKFAYVISVSVLNIEDGEYSVVNRGEMYAVMATITEIFRHFIFNNSHVQCIEFAGEFKKEEDEKEVSIRTRLFHRYCKLSFNLDEWNVTADDNKITVEKKNNPYHNVKPVLENIILGLDIPVKENTPFVHFDFSTNILKIEGPSSPEDAGKFYLPVLDYFHKYSEYLFSLDGALINEYKNRTPIKIEFKLEYFNSTSAKYLLDIIKIFEGLFLNGLKVNIKWYYENEDTDHLESGEMLATICAVPFEFVSYEGDDLFIQPAPLTPTCFCSVAKNTIEISGNQCCPIDGMNFFEKIFKWMELHKDFFNDQTSIVINIGQYNTPASKGIVFLIEKLAAVYREKKLLLKINWHYTDDDSLEEAKEIEAASGVKFHLLRG